MDEYTVYRESKQNFEEVHSRLRRGDIVGVTGKPGKGWTDNRDIGHTSFLQPRRSRVS